jgi:hypothetical protein
VTDVAVLLLVVLAFAFLGGLVWLCEAVRT